SALYNPQRLTVVNATLYLAADDGPNGTEHWNSDGSPSGTAMVADIAPGSAGSGPNELTKVNGTVFVSANDGSNGTELWKSDGTPSGTAMVEDAVPGGGINPGSASSSPSNLTDVNGSLFVWADDGTNGTELWKSNGTPSGTAMVEDAVPGGGINPGSASSSPSNLADVNGTLFFSADDGTNGAEL